MCGRFTYKLTWEEIVALYRLTMPLTPPSNFQPNYNVAPTQIRPIVRPIPNGRELAMARWGLVPFFVRDLKDFKLATFNARSETVQTSATYRQSFQRRRCLVPASGWYEWRAEGKAKQPFHITVKDQPFAFAGLWDTWRPQNGEPLESFTIITTPASEQVAHLHSRMPRILLQHEWEQWTEGDAEAATALLTVSDAQLEFWPVGKAVGNVRNNGPELVEPVDP